MVFYPRDLSSTVYPDSPWKPYVWGVSMVLPALTGYLRVRGGQHYPTDVIAGYLLGGAIGYLIPTLHKRPLKASGLSIYPISKGMHLSYQF
ncbi:MAG: phosphatase PAP2 family protein [Saprospiraceae bacterium]|nr:phosphatase PAP2 family protein [Saprospiraceae bacterium]